MELFYKIEKELKILSACIFLLVPISLLSLPIFFINYILRGIVGMLAKIIRPDLGDFVSGQRALFAQKYSNKALTNIFACAVMEGEVPLELMRQTRQESIFELRSQGKLKYQALKSTWTSFMGWAFWKQDMKFDLKNHIRNYDYEGELAIPNPCNEDDLKLVLGKLNQVPWDRQKSPWEILRVANYTQNGCANTLLIFRMDHVLGDGYSIMDFFKVFLKCEFPMPSLSLGVKKIGFWDKFGLLLRTPFDITENLMMAVENNSQFHNREKLETEEMICVSPQVDVDFLKKMKNHFRVSFVSVIYAAIAGAIERAAKEANQKVPEKLISTIVLPRSNHPGGMCCHFSLSLAAVPISAESSIRRLYQIQRTFEKSSHSSASIGYGLITAVSGYYPIFLRRFIVQNILGLGVLSCCGNFPATNAPDYYEGHQILECFGSFGVMQPLGLTVSTAGLNNKLSFTFSLRKDLFNSESAVRNIGLYAMQELQSLANVI